MIDPQLRLDPPAVTVRTLRQFALLLTLVFGGTAAWMVFGTHHTGFTAILSGVAMGIGAIGLVWPETIRPLFSALIALTLPIGHVVSIVLLGVLFYGVFTPIGLIFRIFGRDPMHVRLPDSPTHWTEKPEVTDPRSYTRQA